MLNFASVVTASMHAAEVLHVIVVRCAALPELAVVS